MIVVVACVFAFEVRRVRKSSRDIYKLGRISNVSPIFHPGIINHCEYNYTIKISKYQTCITKLHNQERKKEKKKD